MSLRRLFSFGLLIFIPVSMAAEQFQWGTLAVFGTAALAIVPLALWLSTATEELAVFLGPSLGALLNAVFGNATELIIALVALKAGLIDIVKASITGTLLANLLLVMGLAMFLGGLKYREQSFQPVVARVNGTSMTLAAIAILLPTLMRESTEGIPEQAIESLSLVTAVVLIVVYILTLIFSLKTHRYLYDVGQVELAVEESSPTPGKIWRWAIILAVATLGVAYESELFVGVVEAATSGLGLSPLFTGVFLLPLVGGAAEYVTAINVALKNNMDLAVSVALGSSLLVALFVAPLLVLLAPFLGQTLDLSFNLFEVIAVVIAITVANLISLDGQSNWLEGSLLLAAYTVLAAAFYFHPA
jgi:Ca2+:H+ antiporter